MVVYNTWIINDVHSNNKNKLQWGVYGWMCMYIYIYIYMKIGEAGGEKEYKNQKLILKCSLIIQKKNKRDGESMFISPKNSLWIVL